MGWGPLPLTLASSAPGNLWYRAGVTPSYPQGSSWEHVSNNVRKVSVGPLDQVGRQGTGYLGILSPLLVYPSCPSDPQWLLGRGFSWCMFQVWVIANKVQGTHGLSRGTVCRRTGVQPREPKGQGWDYGIGVSGPYWQHCACPRLTQY